MKATIDLPDDLVRELKLRAVRDGRKLKDLAADLLRKGLRAAPPEMAKPRVVKDRKTGLPVIQCPAAPPPGKELSPDQLAQVLIDQEAQWARESS